jgi:response regulator RpfG family c-di-GMP phosphodiesterase
MSPPVTPQSLRLMLIVDEPVCRMLAQLLQRYRELEVTYDDRPGSTIRLIDDQVPDVLLVGTVPAQRTISVLAEASSLAPQRRPIVLAHLAGCGSLEWSRWSGLGFDGYILKQLNLSRFMADLHRAIDPIVHRHLLAFDRLP